jgi:hypothetical protein
MPTRKAGFSQLFAFGAGVAVGANWPRASNFVGFILQRLGFELTDLAIWLWDPEKSALRAPETPPVSRPKGKKRTGAPRIQARSLSGKKRCAKTKKTAQALGSKSCSAIIYARGKKTSNGPEPRIRLDRTSTSGSGAGTNVMNDSPFIKSSRVDRQAALPDSAIDHARRVQPVKRASRNDRPKPKSTTVKNKRKTSTSRRGAEFSAFPAAVLPAAAALN